MMDFLYNGDVGNVAFLTANVGEIFLKYPVKPGDGRLFTAADEALCPLATAGVQGVYVQGMHGATGKYRVSIWDEEDGNLLHSLDMGPGTPHDYSTSFVDGNEMVGYANSFITMEALEDITYFCGQLIADPGNGRGESIHLNDGQTYTLPARDGAQMFIVMTGSANGVDAPFVVASPAGNEIKIVANSPVSGMATWEQLD